MQSTRDPRLRRVISNNSDCRKESNDKPPDSQDLRKRREEQDLNERNKGEPEIVCAKRRYSLASCTEISQEDALNVDKEILKRRCLQLEELNTKNEELIAHLRSLLESKRKECMRQQAELIAIKRNINDLNADCLLKIFSYIKEENIFGVCKHWRNILYNHLPASWEPVRLEIQSLTTDSKKFRCDWNVAKYDSSGKMYKEKAHFSGRPEQFFNRMWNVTPFPLVLNRITSIAMLGELLDSCSNWWLQRIREVELHSSMRRHWSDILMRFPRLGKMVLHVKLSSIDKNGNQKNATACASIPDILAAVSDSLNSLRICNFEYNYNEADLVDVLIEKSQRSPSGLKKIRIHSSTSRTTLSPLPAKEIISLLEKAKFDKSSVLIESDSIGVPHKFLKWAMANSLQDFNILDAIVKKDFTHYKYMFTYRSTNFIVAFRCLLKK